MTSVHSTINLNHSDLINQSIVDSFYRPKHVQNVLVTTLNYINTYITNVTAHQRSLHMPLPYFSDLDPTIWFNKSKELDIYLTDVAEARALNSQSRGKDYATNILSYPSELPSFVLQQMPTIPLGELIICHDVVTQQAKEQLKSVQDHATHLIVHGILHLLGFDHEQGDEAAEEMEGFEIDILQQLGLDNPYNT